MPYDVSQEATGCTNEIFYRRGPTPTELRTYDAALVKETIERYLREAYEAGQHAKPGG